MKSLLLLNLSLFFIACSNGQNSKNEFPLGQSNKSPNEQVATFAEGCFWHTEIVFQSLVGVRDAVSGYSGGHVLNPSYEGVCDGNTGHAEAVQVYYDSQKVSYETLVKAFFSSMDPTQLNRQGNDKGSQYRSVAFYRTDKEKAILDAEIKRLTDIKKYNLPIVTEVKPFEQFYPAEKYHQEYVHYHPDNGYVSGVSIPEFLEWKKEFKGSFK